MVKKRSRVQGEGDPSSSQELADEELLKDQAVQTAVVTPFPGLRNVSPALPVEEELGALKPADSCLKQSLACGCNYCKRYKEITERLGAGPPARS